MAGDTAKQNLLGMPQGELERFFARPRDEKPYRARQLMQWLYQRRRHTTSMT